MALKHYEIPRRHKRCVMREEVFDYGVSYFSLIEPIEEGGYERKDYCLNCWKTLVNEIKGKIYWKSSVPKKIEVSEASLRRDERALTLLKDTCQSEDPAELSRAFILALLLTRKKILQLKQEVQEEEQTFILFEMRGTEEMFFVKKVSLSLIQTDEVQRSLAQLLGS